MRKKILIMNLTPRLGMLHYSSQFTNELQKKEGITLKVAIASYYNENLYDNIVKFIKVRTNPTIPSFIFDTLNIFYHIYFLSQVIYFKPDIVHFLDNHPWYSVYAKIFKFLGYKIYVTQHDPVLHSGENDTLLGKIATYTNKILRNICDKLIVHGDILRDQVIKKFNIKADKILSIKHGAYTFFNKWSQGGLPEKDTFLFFGRIVDYKGLDILLKSLEIVQEKFPDFKLLIAGPGDLEKYFLGKYKNNIEIINKNILPEDAYQYFERSEFVVLPYKDATGSGVIPVAYCFSKAVLVTSVGELVSVVKNNKTGCIVKPNDSEELGNKIVEMLHEKNRIKTMGENGKNFSDNELSWKPIIDNIYG